MRIQKLNLVVLGNQLEGQVVFLKEKRNQKYMQYFWRVSQLKILPGAKNIFKKRTYSALEKYGW